MRELDPVLVDLLEQVHNGETLLQRELAAQLLVLRVIEAARRPRLRLAPTPTETETDSNEEL